MAWKNENLHRLGSSLAPAVFLALTPLPGHPSIHPAPQIAVQVNVVTVPVTVTNGHGEFVRGLGQDRFRLLVDGAEQPIEYFLAEEEPAQVLLLVETGPAVFLLRGEHLTALTELIDGLGPSDRVAIGSYSNAFRPLLDFTTDKRQAAAAIGSPDYGIGMAQLNFYKSLSAALDWAAARGTKCAIVVLTTGIDTSGAAQWDSLRAKLQESNVMVLPVALGEELREPGKTSRKQSTDRTQQAEVQSDFAEWDRTLETMAAMTGGYAYFPKSAKDFAEDYRRIASVLRHEYSLGFTTRQQDGRIHTVQVEIVDEPSGNPGEKGRKETYRVNARREFFAPGP